MSEPTLFEILSLLYHRYDAFNDILNAYGSIAIGIVAILISFPKHIYSVTARVIFIICFTIVAVVNMQSLVKINEDRHALQTEAERMMLKFENANARMGTEFQEMIRNPEMIPESCDIQIFHAAIDILVIALIWLLPKNLVPLSPFKSISNKVIRIRNSELPNPIISWDQENRIWILERTEHIQLNLRDFDNIVGITIPSGFKFDLSTIPRLLWSIIAPFELSIIAPLVHDFIYVNKGILYVDQYNHLTTSKNTNKIMVSRHETDTIFLEHMKLEGVGFFKRWVCYIGVRLFGSIFWKDR